jgi:tetratricopeptide (TPR) repeat protein
MEALKQVVDASSYLRKDQSMMSTMSGMFFGGKGNKYAHLKSMNRLQRHAEITFAESYLIKALLSLITEANMVTFMKEGLAIRQSYTIYKTCYKYLLSIFQENGSQGLIDEGIDNHFITSVYLGVGGFNLILSILPDKILRIFEIIGFTGHRDFGLQCLSIGAAWPETELTPVTSKRRLKAKKAVNFFSEAFAGESGLGSRKFICDMMLTLYHVLLSTMVQLPGCDFPLASKVVKSNLEQHPRSFIYLIYQGKISQAMRDARNAIQKLKDVLHIQKDWRQLSHVCFWDLGICYAAIGDWLKAAEYFDILYQENKWSKSIYLYLKAVMLYTADPVKYKSDVAEMMHTVPTLLKKVAGKSIPLEVISINLEIRVQESSQVFFAK